MVYKTSTRQEEEPRRCDHKIHHGGFNSVIEMLQEDTEQKVSLEQSLQDSYHNEEISKEEQDQGKQLLVHEQCHSVQS